MNSKQHVYSVSMVNQYIKNMFQSEYALAKIYVRGEISNCKYHGSGHIYFTIKDKASQINCVMFAGDRGGLSFRMENGQEIIVGGRISVYERDGKYQLYAKEILLSGDGMYYERYEKLKKKLEAEGLFDEAHKKAIPDYVNRVGVVTADTGAAIQDIQNITRRRNPYVQLILYPAKVQGEGAEQTIIAGISALVKEAVDVIIIGRGGGSIEDLWAFNDEELARVIYACDIPIISAVGHETDTTISDYVADLRAPTPSAAAELAVYDVSLLFADLQALTERMKAAMISNVMTGRMRLEQIKMRLEYASPSNQILQKRQFLLETERKLVQFMQQKISENRQELKLLAGKLDVLSPLARLKSGFAYIEKEDGQLVDRADKLKEGDVIGVTFSDGKVSARVTQAAENRK
ncbi:MAG: exodeoxyribonuclease VII large subunit [Lachnospiraceae bacterium]|nr:exodeoxyribonuclease VII large subunit [Lachnospiraceae bacterium]